MNIRDLINLVESTKDPLKMSEERLKDFYMEGNCYYLALALHRMFGWPLYVLGGYEDEHKRDDYRTIHWFHVFVKHPNGMMVDINGPISEAKWLEEWPDCEILPVSEPQLIELMHNSRRPTRLQICQAREIVKRYLMRKYPELFNGAEPK